MKRSTSTLETVASQIKAEVETGFNTATKVGGWMLDLLHSTILEYDPASAYTANRWVIYNGVLAKSIAAASAGQSPVSHPMLWELKLIIDPAQITENAPSLPVAGPAFWQYIEDKLANLTTGGTVPDADATTPGKVRSATIQDFESLLDETIEDLPDINAYIKPALLLYMLDLLFGKGDLDAVLFRGNTSDRDLTAGTINRKRFIEGTATHYPGLIRRNGVWNEVLVPAELIGGGSGGSALPLPPLGGIPSQTMTVGQAFNYTLLPWTNAESIEVKDLPPGLTYNTASAKISGAATAVGTYFVTITGISAAGQRSSITVAFVVQAAPITRSLEELSFQRIGTALKWTLKAEGGVEGIRIKQGTAGAGFTGASFVDMTKVGDRLYEYTYQSVANGNYTARVELKGSTGAIEESFTLDTPSQVGRVYPGQINLVTGKTMVSTSGLDNEKINNLDLGDTFESYVEYQPLIGVTGLIQNGEKARIRSVYIHTDNPALYEGAVLIAGENLSTTAGSLQANLNKSGILTKTITGVSTSPIKIDFDDFQASSLVLIATNSSGKIILNEFQVFGDYPVVNHPPAWQALPVIVRTEGQGLSYDLKGFVSDIDGDALTLTAALLGGFALPSWLTLTNGILVATALPWEGGSLSTIFEYNIVVTATDEHGSSASNSQILRVQHIGTLESLLAAKIHYDFFGEEKRLTIGANVTDAGPMRVNLEGADFTYGGSGWKTMVNGTYGDFTDTNKLINETSAKGGFSNVLPGNYNLMFQESEFGPIISRLITIPSGNIPSFTVYEKTPDTPTGSITSISHSFDVNGKPIINAVATAPVEIAITSLQGGVWTNTGYSPATLVSGNTNYQRAYNTVAPEGSYRYDVRIIGTTTVQSGNFTVGATSSDYFVGVDVSNGGVGFLNLRAQVVAESGVEYKFSTDTGNFKQAVYNAGMVNLIPGAKGYQASDPIPTSTVERTMLLRKPGTTQVLSVTIPAGQAADDGQWHSIYSAQLLVKKGGFLYDGNNDSMSVYFEPQDATKQYQVWLETVSGAAETGVNFGSSTDSGAWSTGIWYDLFPYTTIAGFSLRRRLEKGAGGGVLEVPHRIKIREKNTESPIQTLTFTPAQTSNQDTIAFAITGASGGSGGGTTTPPPVVNPDRMTTVNEVFGVKHGVTYSGNMTDLKAELQGGFDRGMSGIKLTIYYHDWVNPTAKAAFINVFDWVIAQGKKFAIHFNMSYERNNGHLPAFMDTSKADLYSDGSTDSNYLRPALTQNDGFFEWLNDGSTTNWNSNTPQRRLYDDMVISALQTLSARGPIWFVSKGETHTGEGGYDSEVGDIATAKFSGYGPGESAAFKTWLYAIAPTNNITGVRNLLGNQTITDGQLVPPVPSRSSFEVFYNVMKGPGLPQAWYEFRTRRIMQQQKMFEYFCRQTLPGVIVGFEAGSFRGNQAIVNGTTEVKTISSTADFVKANLTWGDDWELGADVGRGLNINHMSDGDGSLWDPVVQLWRRGYNITGQYSHNDVANMFKKYFRGGGIVGVFGDITKFYPVLTILKNQNALGATIAAIYNTKTVIWSSDGERNHTGNGLGSWTGFPTNVILNENPWPALAA